MIIYQCIKFKSNTPILSKDIARKPKVLHIGWLELTDVRTESSDTICTPIENGVGIKKNISICHLLKSLPRVLHIKITGKWKPKNDSSVISTIQQPHKSWQ